MSQSCTTCHSLNTYPKRYSQSANPNTELWECCDCGFDFEVWVGSATDESKDEDDEYENSN
jgi:hypothetical protein